MFPTVVLRSADQFRPGPPPDFENEMKELKNFKPTFKSKATAFYWATQADTWTELRWQEDTCYLIVTPKGNIHQHRTLCFWVYFFAKIIIFRSETRHLKKIRLDGGAMIVLPGRFDEKMT